MKVLIFVFGLVASVFSNVNAMTQRMIDSAMQQGVEPVVVYTVTSSTPRLQIIQAPVQHKLILNGKLILSDGGKLTIGKSYNNLVFENPLVLQEGMTAEEVQRSFASALGGDVRYDYEMYDYRTIRSLPEIERIFSK